MAAVEDGLPMVSSTIACATPRMLLREPRCRRTSATAALGDARERRAASARPPGCTGGPWLARLRRALAEDLLRPALPADRRRCGTGASPTTRRSCASPTSPTGALIAPGQLPAGGRALRADPGDRPDGARQGRRAARARRHGERDVASPINVSALSVTDPGDARRHRARCSPATASTPRAWWSRSPRRPRSPTWQRARRFCAGVQALGCAVALDDFGAGFGSFQYLQAACPSAT